MFLSKNKPKIEVSFFLFFSILLTSCGKKFFPEFKVESALLENQKLVLKFSAPPKPSTLKENFLFLQDSENIGGEFSFEGSSVLFFPKAPIEENHCYEIQILSGAEDINGNSLFEEYKKTFYTKEDLSRPEILNIENLIGTEGETTALKIRFNKKMNEHSFSENFSIEPNAQFITKWNESLDTAELVFTSALIEKTFYAVKISSGTKDFQNNSLAKDFLWGFENAPLYTPPDYTVYVFNDNTKNYQVASGIMENADFSKEIKIQFNKKINSEIFPANIFVEKKIGYEVKAVLNESSNFSDCAKIRFTETPLWNTEYRVFISENILDSYGNAAPKKSFLLKNNSEKLRPPTIEFILLEFSEKVQSLSKKENLKNITVDSSKYAPGTQYNLPITFVFRISTNSQSIDEISAINSILIDAANSCVRITPICMNICSYEDMLSQSTAELSEDANKIVQELGLQNANLCCVKFDTQFFNGESGSQITNGLINFKIAKTLCDNNKNYMEEAVQISCNKM